MSYPDELRFLNDLVTPDEVDGDLHDGQLQSICPDPAIIAILAEHGMEGDLAGAFRRHVIRCESCADLFNRLRDFQRAALEATVVGEQDQKWDAVRPRLEFAIQKIARPDDRPKPAPWWKSFSFAGLSQPASLAFASCLALMVAGASVLLYSMSSTHGAAEVARSRENRALETAANPDPTRFRGSDMASSNSASQRNSGIDGPAEPGGGSGISAQTGGDRLDDRAANDPQTSPSLELNAGESLRMTAEVVDEGPGPAYKVDGRLTVQSGSGTVLLFSGTLTAGSQANTISIRELLRNGRHYPLGSRQTAHVGIEWPRGATGIHAGEELDVHLISRLSIQSIEK